MDVMVAKPKVVPFSLKDAPSLIERVWPAQKISVETKREFDAHGAQTLTALGSYWKGRKRLIYVRACALGAILPSTGDDEQDLAVFESLMAIDDRAFLVREQKTKPTEFAPLAIQPGEIALEDVRNYFGVRGVGCPSASDYQEAIQSQKLVWLPDLTDVE